MPGGPDRQNDRALDGAALIFSARARRSTSARLREGSKAIGAGGGAISEKPIAFRPPPRICSASSPEPPCGRRSRMAFSISAGAAGRRANCPMDWRRDRSGAAGDAFDDPLAHGDAGTGKTHHKIHPPHHGRPKPERSLVIQMVGTRVCSTRRFMNTFEP